jgi:hypothetical protein
VGPRGDLVLPGFEPRTLHPVLIILFCKGLVRFGDLCMVTLCHSLCSLAQCFSTAGPRPGTGPWHQLFRAARGSPGICHFSFLSIFHE